MAHISIIGHGNMGQAIAAVLGRAGHEVAFVGHDATEPLDGEVVVLAVPYASLADIVATRRGQFAGRIVVDLTNPVDFATFDRLVVAPDSSAAAELQTALPDARVLKAFNTTFAATLASGTVGPLPTTVLVAGDDEDAKQVLAGLVEPGGVRVVDAGALRRARELEAMGFLQITLAARGKVAWTGGFGVIA